MERKWNCLNAILPEKPRALQELFVALKFKRRMAIIRRVADTSKMLLLSAS